MWVRPFLVQHCWHVFDGCPWRRIQLEINWVSTLWRPYCLGCGNTLTFPSGIHFQGILETRRNSHHPNRVHVATMSNSASLSHRSAERGQSRLLISASSPSYNLDKTGLADSEQGRGDKTFYLAEKIITQPQDAEFAMSWSPMQLLTGGSRRKRIWLRHLACHFAAKSEGPGVLPADPTVNPIISSSLSSFVNGN